MSEFLHVAATAHGLITLLVFAVSILLFVTGWLAPEVTGLLAAALLVAFKVLKPDQAVHGFGSPALVTLMGLFAVSAGLFRSGGLHRLRAMIASDSIGSPRRLIVLTLAVVSPISGFITNTPIVATLLPVLEGWCQRRQISPSRVMLPMAFAVVLGGTISLRRIGAARVVGVCFREVLVEPWELNISSLEMRWNRHRRLPACASACPGRIRRPCHPGRPHWQPA